MSNIKNILVFTNHFNPEQFRINDIAQNLFSRGYNVEIVTQTPNYPNKDKFKKYGAFRNNKENIDGVQIYRLPVIKRGNGKLSLLFNYISWMISSILYAKFTSKKPDFIFVYQTSPVFIVRAAKILASRLGIPYFVYVLDVWPKTLYEMINIPNVLVNIFDKYCLNSYSGASKLLITSKGFQEPLTDLGIDKNLIEYWPQYAESFYKPYIDVELFQKSPEVTKFVFTGNIGEAQGLHVLLDAVKNLQNEDLNFSFTLVGEGRFKAKLQEMIESEGLGKYFSFMDSVKAQDIPKVLSNFDVAVLTLEDSPLFNNLVPAKLQSYMACGMPILASVNGESSIVIHEAECGYSSKSGDGTELAELIKKFCIMPTKTYINFKLNSLIYSKNNYECDKLMNTLVQWIES